MSYNATEWRTKELHGFRLRIEDLRKAPNRSWEPDVLVDGEPPGTCTFRWMESVSVRGVKDGDWLVVSGIECVSEGSGYVMNAVLEPAFKNSQGVLKAAVVWEGGDSIQRLSVVDGKVEWEEVEL